MKGSTTIRVVLRARTMFWVCVVMTSINLLLMAAAPAQARPSFGVGACGFAMGMIANYLILFLVEKSARK